MSYTAGGFARGRIPSAWVKAEHRLHAHNPTTSLSVMWSFNLERHSLSMLNALLLLLWLAVVFKQQWEGLKTECFLKPALSNDKDECRCCSFLRLTETFDDSMNKNIIFIKTPKAASSTMYSCWHCTEDWCPSIFPWCANYERSHVSIVQLGKIEKWY